jgi:hypothetical protein
MAYTTIDKSTDHFTTTLWTGDSTTPKTFTTGTFKPDWLWGKNRSQAYAHQLYDTTRGAGNDKEIVSNSNGAEGASNPETYGYVSAFTSTGFTATRGTDSAGDDYWNESPDNYVAWSWKANGGTTSSNSDGSITSTVQANTTAGFSISTWTGTGANGTIGHGLGAKPEMIIVKNYSASQNWCVYHSGLSGTEGHKTLYLDLNYAEADQTGLWNDTAATSSVFSVGTNTNTNGSSASMIAYAFAEKTGYSKFGSYVGNGSNDGVFCHLGFKPAMVIYKKSSGTENWFIHDNKRQGYNPDNELLFPDLSNAEGTVNRIDLLSNGFKARTSDGGINGSGATYIYMAFAEAPLVGSNNVPCTAR